MLAALIVLGALLFSIGLVLFVVKTLAKLFYLD